MSYPKRKFLRRTFFFSWRISSLLSSPVLSHHGADEVSASDSAQQLLSSPQPPFEIQIWVSRLTILHAWPYRKCPPLSSSWPSPRLSAFSCPGHPPSRPSCWDKTSRAEAGAAATNCHSHFPMPTCIGISNPWATGWVLRPPSPALQHTNPIFPNAHIVEYTHHWHLNVAA